MDISTDEYKSVYMDSVLGLYKGPSMDASTDKNKSVYMDFV